uniref:BACK domain-containing protein n=1 Tax=Parascaris univalens TaxID=6257 RepID=A0A914ZZ45_PARUN
ATSPGVLRLMASAASSGGKKTVVIRSHKNNFVLEVDIFAKYSDVIKKLQQANKLPATLDLSNYAVTAVSTLCDFINDTGRANARITTLVLGDLMELSGILQIGVLRQKIDRVCRKCYLKTKGYFAIFSCYSESTILLSGRSKLWAEHESL